MISLLEINLPRSCNTQFSMNQIPQQILVTQQLVRAIYIFA